MSASPRLQRYRDRRNRGVSAFWILQAQARAAVPVGMTRWIALAALALGCLPGPTQTVALSSDTPETEQPLQAAPEATVGVADTEATPATLPSIELMGLPDGAILPAAPPAPKLVATAEPAAAVAPIEPVTAAPKTYPTITFSIAGDDVWNARFPVPVLAPSLEQAVSRWSRATCREMTVLPEGGQHTVSWGDKTNVVSGRLGQTTGDWDAAIIRAVKVTEPATSVIVAHELGHLLARSNEHAADGVYGSDPFPDQAGAITEASLTKVCAALECLCFQPESSEPAPAVARQSVRKVAP